MDKKTLVGEKILILIIVMLVVVSIFSVWWFSGPVVVIKFAEPEDLELTISSEEGIIKTFRYNEYFNQLVKR